MIQQRIRRYVVNTPLQFVYRRDSHDFQTRCRVFEREITETETLLNSLSKVDRELFRCFVKENAVEIGNTVTVLTLGRLDYDRQIRITHPHMPCKPNPGLRVLDTVAHKRHIGNQTQHFRGKLLIKPHRLLIIPGKDDLGTPAHAQHLLMLVKGFCGKRHTLFQKELIEMRQNRRIEPHRILNHENHLHTDFEHIVLGIHLILKKLDYGKQEVDVAKP